MKPKRHLSFGQLRNYMSETFMQIDDVRQEAKIDYQLHDALMCGYACMYFQDPSLLQFQKHLEDEQHRSNLTTLFNVHNIPTNNQIKNIIDEIDPKNFCGVFNEYFYRLRKGKYLDSFRFLDNYYLCSMDGTQYYYSENVHCDQCLTTKLKNGNIGYSHKVLQAAIIHPDHKQVIPLMPEEISNRDTGNKQDSEVAASERFLTNLRRDHPRLDLLIGGDAIFPKQPVIEHILALSMHYLFRIKLTDHKYLQQYIKDQSFEEVRINDPQGRQHIYEWVNNVPLNGDDNTVRINFIRYRIVTPKEGKPDEVVYIGNWATDLEISSGNITELVRGGRSRYKIENECFNALKNQGYYLEHSYGHGNNHLCFNFFVLTVLAFYLHQIFELTDQLYQACREKFGSKHNMWSKLRAYITILIFDTWELLLRFALNPKAYNPTMNYPPSAE